MKKIFFLLVVVQVASMSFAERQFDLTEDLRELDARLRNQSYYDQEHHRKADSLRKLEPNTSFETCLSLFELYASHCYDSAVVYVEKMDRLAHESGDEEQIAVATIKRGFAYLSAGLFKEAYDLFENMDISHCSRETQILYYRLYARLAFDLADYDAGKLRQTYQDQGVSLLDKEMRLLADNDTAHYEYALALRAMKSYDQHLALAHFKLCLSSHQISDHDRAIMYSSMAFPALQLGHEDDAFHYMILAAIYDIQSSTREGVALCYVASMLHDRGDHERAYAYISKAQRNAIEYGARHRQLEISLVLPIIEQEQLRLSEQFNQRVIVLVIIISLLLICMLVGILLLQNRIGALRKAKQTIEDKNMQLAELGRLKEEYIGTFFGWQSDLVREIDSEHTHLRRLSQEKKIVELQQYINGLPRQNRRQDFIKRFDEMFLRICPNFVEQFNSLLQEDARIQLKQGELLTTELRIFALIHLGVTDNEKISQVLDYSVNTIYTYKTRMRNRAAMSSDEFDEAIKKLG